MIRELLDRYCVRCDSTIGPELGADTSRANGQPPYYWCATCWKPRKPLPAWLVDKLREELRSDANA